MLDKSKLKFLLDESLKTGADFAEIFFEDTNRSSLRVTSGEVTDTNFSNIHGAGVRLIKNSDVVYGYTNDITEKSLFDLIKKLRGSFTGKPSKSKDIGNSKPFKNDIEKPMDEVSQTTKANVLIGLSNRMKKYDKRIVQAISILLHWQQKILVVNSEEYIKMILETMQE